MSTLLPSLGTDHFARLALIAALAGLLGTLQSSTSAAAELVVTTAEDEDNTDADCSLREAIRAANDDIAVDACGSGSLVDVITVPPGTYVLDLGQLSVSSVMTINGSGAGVTILDGDGSSRILAISGGDLTLDGVTVRNGADSAGAGINVSSSTLMLSNSVVTGNQAIGDGGGINNSSGTVTIVDTTVSENQAGRDGGGINSSSGTTALERVTLSGNDADVDGGGIQISDGTVSIVNGTISGNFAGDQGGGLFKTGGTVTLTHVTIADNGATTAGGGVFQTGGTITLANTIVGNSTSGDDCAGGAPISNGGNLDSDGSCSLTGAGDLSSTAPLLGPLAANGGPTFTHALVAGSPAIDAGSAPGCPASDQRGVMRPQDGDGDTIAVCDIGAYEAEGGTLEPPAAIPTLRLGTIALFSLLLTAVATVVLRARG
ncbi:MAG TPA: choice-of-anchor Q domain-containing protein [Thermoanaerobaculia bacterium]|nr:choice-of-anchor Q domain-containing protein [Thermoanaerobaculia bacterium]